MKLGEVVVNIEYYNFTKFHYILMKKIIVFYQTHLTDGPSVRRRWIRPKCSHKWLVNDLIWLDPWNAWNLVLGRIVQGEIEEEDDFALNRLYRMSTIKNWSSIVARAQKLFQSSIDPSTKGLYTGEQPHRDGDQSVYMYVLLLLLLWYGLALVLYYDQKKKKKRNKWSDSGHNQDIV